MKFQKTSRTKIIFQNIFIVFFILVIALSAVSYFLSRFHFNELVKEKFIENFKNANANKYELTIESVSTNLLRGYILIKNTKIQKQKQYAIQKYLFVEKISVPIIEIKQISLYDLIKGNYLKSSFFIVQNSETDIVFNENPQTIDSVDSFLFYNDNESIMAEMSIGIFSINNANIRIKNALNDSIIFSVDAFNFELKDIKMNTAVENYIKKLDNISDINSLITVFNQ